MIIDNASALTDILVVDDNLPDLRLLVNILTSAGYRPRPARDGETALRSAAARWPALVLLDVTLPGIDGYEVCQRLMGTDALLPVIFISARDELVDRARALDFGGRDFIRKPFQAEDVLARVRAQLRLHQAEMALRDAQAQLQAEAASLAALIENTDASIWSVDRDYRLVRANRQFQQRLTAWGTRAAPGDSMLPASMPAEERAEWQGYYDRALREGPFTVVRQTHLPSGDRYTQYFIHPIITEDGSRLGVTIFGRDVTGRMQAAAALEASARQLGERVKELNCLYELSRLVDTPEATLEGILRGAAALLPPAWQHPEIACARITVADQVYTTDNFLESRWRQASRIVVHGRLAGMAEVFYLEMRSEADEGPFLREERQLLDAVSERLGRIIERFRTEQALQTEHAFRGAIEASQAGGITTVDLDGRTTYVNPAFCQMVGWAEDELVGGKPPFAYWPPEEEERIMTAFQATLAGRVRSGGVEMVFRRRNEERFHVQVLAAPLSDGQRQIGWVGNIINITARKQLEAQLKASLAEKDTLLRELYHRTKNNLQVVCSLLNLHADNAGDDMARRVFHEMENRVRSMALVHQKLYQARNLSHLNLREYMLDLASLLLHTYNVSPGTVRLAHEMEDVFTTVDVAIPCGLVVNELISNSLKHAFPGGQGGEIRLSLRRLAQGKIQLEVADDGVGLPAGLDWRRSATLGLVSVTHLVEHQLNGQLEASSGPGLRWQIRFSDRANGLRL